MLRFHCSGKTDFCTRMKRKQKKRKFQVYYTLVQQVHEVERKRLLMPIKPRNSKSKMSLSYYKSAIVYLPFLEKKAKSGESDGFVWVQ